MTASRAVVAAVAAASLMLGVASCGEDDPEPRRAPTPPATSSAATTPTDPADPVLGPEETVRAWVEAQNEALRTGDTSSLEDLSADKCTTCDQFIEPIRNVYTQGGRFRGGAWKLEGSKLRAGKSQQKVVNAAITVGGGSTQASADAEVVDYGSEKHILVFKLVSEGDGWSVTFVGFVS